MYPNLDSIYSKFWKTFFGKWCLSFSPIARLEELQDWRQFYRKSTTFEKCSLVFQLRLASYSEITRINCESTDFTILVYIYFITRLPVIRHKTTIIMYLIRLSPKPARKLSTLVEEDLVETDNSSPDNVEELSRRIALESSFHDNDRVLTTFSEVHSKTPGSTSVPQSSPARYASVMSVKLDCNSPISSPRYMYCT